MWNFSVLPLSPNTANILVRRNPMFWASVLNGVFVFMYLLLEGNFSICQFKCFCSWYRFLPPRCVTGRAVNVGHGQKVQLLCVQSCCGKALPTSQQRRFRSRPYKEKGRDLNACRLCPVIKSTESKSVKKFPWFSHQQHNVAVVSNSYLWWQAR